MMMATRILFKGLVALALALAGCTGNIAPVGGASYSGTIDLGDKGSSGEIRFKVSEDGTSIKELDIIIKGLVCDGLSAGRVHDFMQDPKISILNGEFSSSLPPVGGEVENYNLETSPSEFPLIANLDRMGHIEGRFSSATQVNGTIRIFMWVVATDHVCELGEFRWQAETP